jgi:tetratricopeptide (TPR) repeat protein
VVAALDLGKVLAELGDLVGAREHIESALAQARTIGRPVLESSVLQGAGALEESAGRPEEAERLYSEALALRRTIGSSGTVAETLTALARVLLSQDRAEEAEKLVAEARRLVVEEDSPGTAVLAVALQALLPGGDAAAAVENFGRLEGRLGHGERMEARFLLFRATGDVSHLRAAHRLLAERAAEAPAAESVLSATVLHREIEAAYRERFGPGGS